MGDYRNIDGDRNLSESWTGSRSSQCQVTTFCNDETRPPTRQMRQLFGCCRVEAPLPIAPMSTVHDTSLYRAGWEGGLSTWGTHKKCPSAKNGKNIKSLCMSMRTTLPPTKTLQGCDTHTPTLCSPRKTSKPVCTWSGERLTNIQATSRPDHLWPENLVRNARSS